MTNGKQNISSCTRSMATKFGSVVAYDEGKSPMMSHDPLPRGHVGSCGKLKA